MWSLLRSMLLILAAALALRATRSQSKWLTAYFVSQIVCDVILLAEGFHLDSPHYALLFSITTFAILIASAGYVFEVARRESRHLKSLIAFESLMLTLFVSSICFEAVHRFWGLGAKIALGEASALLSLGIALASVARRPLNGILASLWVTLGLWEYSYSLGLPREVLLRLNEWIPATLVGGAFLLISCRPAQLLGRQRHS